MPKNYEILLEPLTEMIRDYPTLAKVFVGLVVIGLFSRQLREAAKLLYDALSPAWKSFSVEILKIRDGTATELRGFKKLRAIVHFAMAFASAFVTVGVIGHLTLIILGITIKKIELPTLELLGLGIFFMVLVLISIYSFVQACWFARRGRDIWNDRG